MTKLKLRLKPKYSLLDLDVPAIEACLENLSCVTKYHVVDARAGDAGFVTAWVALKAVDEPTRAALCGALCGLKRMTPYVVDVKRNAAALGSVDLDALRRFAESVSGVGVWSD